MSRTEFFKPSTLAEALELLNQYQERAVVVNGGTDIVEKIGDGSVNPEAIIYIKDVVELNEIHKQDGDLVIGGAVSYEKIQNSNLCRALPGLIEAVSEIGSPPIRVVATAAGNIQTAAPAPDCSVMLLGLGAKLVLTSLAGDRVVELSDFFIKRGQTVLRADELIRQIVIPAQAVNSKTAYKRMARRKAQDIAKVLVGVSMVVEDGICQKIQIGLGALNATPVRAYSLEAIMTGKRIEDGLRQIKTVFPEEANLRISRFTEFKQQVTNTIICRAIEQASGR